MKLGVMIYQDALGNQRTSYVYYATSFAALMEYATVLQGLTTADIVDIRWSNDAAVRWVTGIGKEMTWNEPPLAYAGTLPNSGLPGYGVKCVAAIRQRRTRCAIIAPIFAVFEDGGKVKRNVGETLTTAFAALIARELQFVSGTLITGGG